MKFVAAALALVSALALVAAADDRQTIDFTDADGGEGFW
jgi:Spy/CpxP family protein refolding chaperone